MNDAGPWKIERFATELRQAEWDASAKFAEQFHAVGAAAEAACAEYGGKMRSFVQAVAAGSNP